MRNFLSGAATLALCIPLVLCGGSASAVGAPAPRHDSAGTSLRVAAFTVGLSRSSATELDAALRGGQDQKAAQVAQLIQGAAPDVVLINGIDAGAVDTFRDEYLAVSQGGRRAQEYRYSYAGPVNNGKPGGVDLNGDDIVGGEDVWGRGNFPGQGSMVLLSKYPLVEKQEMGEFAWNKLPDNRLGATQLPPEAKQIMPLVSGGLWDVEVSVGRQRVHVVAAALGQSGEGADYAVERHRDELRFVRDYLSAESYLRDNAGKPVGLEGECYIVLGDLSLPRDAPVGELDELLDFRKHANLLPSLAAESQQLPYLLPSNGLQVSDSGVSLPAGTGVSAVAVPNETEHRLVWVDIDVD